jgi:hypothetical protein
MANCALGIELAPHDRPYVAGEPVEGVVRVTLDENCACKRLDVMLVLGVVRQGRQADVDGHAVGLFAGEWKPGAHEYAFSLPAPTGPVDYAGANMSLSWRVEARADIPWKLDPKAAKDIALHEAEGAVVNVAAAATGGPDDVDTPLEDDSTFGAGCYVPLGLIVLVCLLGLGIGVPRVLGGGQSGLAVVSTIGLLLTVAVLYYLFGPSNRSEAPGIEFRSAGRPQLRVQESAGAGYRAQPGESTLDCHFWVKRSCPALDVRATLVVTEIVKIRRSEHHVEVLTDVVHRRVASLSKVGNGEYFGAVPLPTGVPRTFSARGASIEWTLTVVGRHPTEAWTTSQNTVLAAR